MSYYLVRQKLSLAKNGSDPEDYIVESIHPLGETYHLKVFNDQIYALGYANGLMASSDKERLDQRGRSFLYNYIDYQLWIYDVKHTNNLAFFRDLKINQVVDQSS